MNLENMIFLSKTGIFWKNKFLIARFSKFVIISFKYNNYYLQNKGDSN